MSDRSKNTQLFIYCRTTPNVREVETLHRLPADALLWCAEGDREWHAVDTDMTRKTKHRRHAA